MAHQVGRGTHADVAGERKLSGHHDQGGGQQAPVQMPGHQGLVLSEQQGGDTHHDNDPVLGVNLEQGQAVVFNVGGGKVAPRDRAREHQRSAAKSQVQTADRHGAPQHEWRQKQSGGLQEARRHPKLRCRVAAAHGHQLHALKGEEVEQIEPRAPANAHRNEHHEVVAGEVHRGGGHHQRSPSHQHRGQFGQGVAEQVTLLAGPPGERDHHGGRQESDPQPTVVDLVWG